MSFHSSRLNLLTFTIAIVCTALISGCSQKTEAPPEVSSVTPTSNFKDHLPDLEAKELIGMTENQIQSRLYTKKYSNTSSGMSSMNDFGRVRYRHQIVDLTRLVAPEEASKYRDYTAEFTAIAACVRHDERTDSYSIFVGGLPSPLITPAILAQAKHGDFNQYLTEYNGCRAPGPKVPISLVS